MEKAKLLQELADLKCMIRHHENSLAAINRNPENAPSSQKGCEYKNITVINRQKSNQIINEHKNMIFVNPNKLNILQNDKTCKSENNINVGEIINKNVVKVYINPNFTKSKAPPVSSTQQKIPLNNKLNLHKELNLKSFKSEHATTVNDAGGLHQEHNKSHQCHSKDSAPSIALARNNNIIFVNPGFNIPTRVTRNTSGLYPNKVVQVGNVTSTLDGNNKIVLLPKNSYETARLSVKDLPKLNLLKRKLDLNSPKTEKESPCIKKNKKSEESICKPSNKVFLNPKFENGLKESTVIRKTKLFGSLNNISKSNTVQNENEISVSAPNAGSNLLKTKESLSSRSNVLSFPQGCVKGPVLQTEPEKKLTNQRVRTRSTSLVSISSTKLIRKRRSSRSIFEPVAKANLKQPVPVAKANLKQPVPVAKAYLKQPVPVAKANLKQPVPVAKANLKQSVPVAKANLKQPVPVAKAYLKQPVFISKTKLVRCSPSKKMNGSVIKPKVKRVLPRIHLQCLSPDKINKLRKQSFISSITDLANIVTKIESKNGKSLKLIRNGEQNKSTSAITKIQSKNGKSLKLIRNGEQNKSSSAITKIQSKNGKSLKLIRNGEQNKSSSAITKIKSKNGKSLKLIRNGEQNKSTSAITKIQSKNGKSLKLIRKSEGNLHTSILMKIKSKNGKSLKLIRNGEQNKSTSAITKIQSKNGKSLKLINRNDISNKPSYDLRKTTNIVQKRKHMPRQQYFKNSICIVQNKWKKSQFSKTNVLTKKRFHHASNIYKYVNKNKEVTYRKQFLKSKSFDKPGKSPIKKYQGTNSVSEKCSLKSKYKFISKEAANRKNKMGRSYKNTTPNKRNWKLKQNMTNRNFKRKDLSIVNIGGVFYRCSRTTLSRNKSTSNKVSQNQSKGLLLRIQGQKFKFDDNGQTLTCLDEKPGRTRIDIGGVTYISSSSGASLTRTNYHTARSFLVQAKQKSISLLTRNLRKNNEPCLFFHRLGRCSGQERGICFRQHDPKYVMVCKKFVQGCCANTGCLLSHTISCHNMPTCHHFLAGNCGRDHCPYPHIKVSDSAPICLDFLKGFCPLGDQCTKRHFAICPSFEKGMCSRGKYCPYPHPKSRSNQVLKGKLKPLEKKYHPTARDAEPVSNCNLRYFHDINLQKENLIELSEDPETSEENEDRSRPFKKRTALGRLPSFIPLSLEDTSTEET